MPEIWGAVYNIFGIGRPRGGTVRELYWLLALLLLDRFVDLGLYGFQVEARGRLHRRKLEGSARKFTHELLHPDEPPELARIEIIHVASAKTIHVHAAD